MHLLAPRPQKLRPGSGANPLPQSVTQTNSSFIRLKLRGKCHAWPLDIVCTALDSVCRTVIDYI